MAIHDLYISDKKGQLHNIPNSWCLSLKLSAGINAQGVRGALLGLEEISYLLPGMISLDECWLEAPVR